MNHDDRRILRRMLAEEELEISTEENVRLRADHIERRNVLDEFATRSETATRRRKEKRDTQRKK